MLPFHRLCLTVFFVLSFASCSQPQQDLTVSNAWVRETAPGQQVAAAYMDLTSRYGAILERVDSEVAGNIEIHTMSMEDDVMKMRMLEELNLPPGETIKLAPGGLHLMLLDLRHPLEADTEITLTLSFRNSDGSHQQAQISAQVKAIGNDKHAH